MIRRPPRSTLFPTRRSSDLSPPFSSPPLEFYVGSITHTQNNLREKGALFSRNVDRKSTRLNSSHDQISYAVFCLKKKKTTTHTLPPSHPPPSTSHTTPPTLH